MSPVLYLDGPVAWSVFCDELWNHWGDGWRLAVADRWWTVVAIQIDDDPAFHGCFLRTTRSGVGTFEYEDAVYFRSLKAAQTYIEQMPPRIREFWHPLGLGDAMRYEQWRMRERTEVKPRFVGSIGAITAHLLVWAGVVRG